MARPATGGTQPCELRDLRNKCAHQRTFSGDDAYRALDSAGRLLEVGGHCGHEALDRLRNVVGRVESSWRHTGAQRAVVFPVCLPECPPRRVHGQFGFRAAALRVAVHHLTRRRVDALSCSPESSHWPPAQCRAVPPVGSSRGNSSGCLLVAMGTLSFLISPTRCEGGVR
jgi:Swt1-like HEPN